MSILRISTLILCFTLLCFTLGACTSELRLDNSLVARLNSRGIVALSQDNPFLAGNLFLNREAEQHPELHGFLAKRGIPTAMELSQGFFAPIYIKLYYPKENQTYLLSETSDAWMIEGPKDIPLEKQQELSAFLGLAFLGQPNSFNNEFKEPNAIFEPASLSLGTMPPPLKTKKPLYVDDVPKTPFESFKSPAFGILDEIPLLSPSPTLAPPAKASKATSISDNLSTGEEAEISPKGDLVHYVTYPEEDLKMLARWYTYDSSNAAAIGRINKIKSNAELQVGDTIIVPKYMVKNKGRLTAAAVKALSLK